MDHGRALMRSAPRSRPINAADRPLVIVSRRGTKRTYWPALHRLLHRAGSSSRGLRRYLPDWQSLYRRIGLDLRGLPPAPSDRRLPRATAFSPKAYDRVGRPPLHLLLAEGHWREVKPTCIAGIWNLRLRKISARRWPTRQVIGRCLQQDCRWCTRILTVCGRPRHRTPFIGIVAWFLTGTAVNEEAARRRKVPSGTDHRSRR